MDKFSSWLGKLPGTTEKLTVAVGQVKLRVSVAFSPNYFNVKFVENRQLVLHQKWLLAAHATLLPCPPQQSHMDPTGPEPVRQCKGDKPHVIQP